ncbi:MAG: hypothetical protein EPO26_04075 [Chloroflexota bacterium]|nr:MAG: hypothetical protein EPO26_04075 [Chloroflexota bacterium]
MLRPLLLAVLVLFLVGLAIPSLTAPRSASAVGSATGVYFGTYGGSENASKAGRIAGVGVKAVRMYVEWEQLENVPDLHGTSSMVWTQKLAEYDQRLVDLKASGLTPIVFISSAPTWAASRPRGPLFTSKVTSYVEFVSNLVRRWSVPTFNVKHWELWGEPDFGNTAVNPAYAGREAWGDDPVKFAEMLRATYPAIKAIDPGATVIMGSLAFDNFRTSDGPGFNTGGSFVYRFLDNVLINSGGEYFDWLAFNAYSVFSTGWERDNPSAGFDIVAKAAHIRSVMANRGVSKPLVILEGGMWSCCGASGPGTHYYVKADNSTGTYIPGENEQAAYLVQLYARGLAADLKGIFWYLIDDYEAPSSLTDPDGHRGWWRTTGVEKPAADAMRRMTSKLSGATYAGVPSEVATVSGRIEARAFTKADGSRMVVAWSVYGPSETATIRVTGSAVAITDALGQSVAISSVGSGVVQATIGFTPIYIEGATAPTPTPTFPPVTFTSRLRAPLAPRFSGA